MGNFHHDFFTDFWDKTNTNNDKQSYSKINVADPGPHGSVSFENPYMDPHQSEKLNPNTHQSKNLGAVETHNEALEGRRRSQWRRIRWKWSRVESLWPRGCRFRSLWWGIGSGSAVYLHQKEKSDRIRMKVKSLIWIRITMKKGIWIWIRVRDQVMRIRNISGASLRI